MHTDSRKHLSLEYAIEHDIMHNGTMVQITELHVGVVDTSLQDIKPTGILFKFTDHVSFVFKGKKKKKKKAGRNDAGLIPPEPVEAEGKYWILLLCYWLSSILFL